MEKDELKALQKDAVLINGISMYYEIYGHGSPLVLLHGGGSTIKTSFGAVIPFLQHSHQLICIELQAHGRTTDRPGPISFDQDAADVAALIAHLGFNRCDLLGFSNGANTALKIGINHPAMCGKIIACSPLLKKNGAFAGFWDFMKNGTYEEMPQAYKTAFHEVNPKQALLLNMYKKCAERMNNFTEFTDEELQSMQNPVLIINGDKDVATCTHVSLMSQVIPNGRLAILPGGHGAYMGEITSPLPSHEIIAYFNLLVTQFLGDRLN